MLDLRRKFCLEIYMPCPQAVRKYLRSQNEWEYQRQPKHIAYFGEEGSDVRGKISGTVMALVFK